MSSKKGGRKIHPYYEALLFDFTKLNDGTGKAACYCRLCDRILKNTSQERMRKHRRQCCPKEEHPGGSRCIAYLAKMETIRPLSSYNKPRNRETRTSGNDPLFLSEEDGLFVDMDTDDTPLAALSIKQENLESIVTKKNQPIAITSVSGSVGDGVSNRDKDQIDIAIAKFMYGCNIPFSVIESDHFRSLIRILRPTYYLPNAEDISEKLLSQVYEDVANPIKMSESKLIPNETTLLIQCSTLSNIVTMLQTNDGKCSYLETYNYANLTGQIGKALTKACQNAIALAKERHDVNVFGIVSEHSEEIAKNWQTSEYWLNICNNSLANQLGQKLIDQSIVMKVTNILSEFKSMENTLIENGGSQIVLATDLSTILQTFQSLTCFIVNLPHMHDIANETNDVADNIITMIFDDEFIQCIRDNVQRINSITELLKKCQTLNYSIADVTEQWLDMPIDELVLTIDQQRLIRETICRAVTVYGLTANFLHPIYRGTKLNGLQMDLVDEFLLNSLEVNGLNSLMEFKNDSGMFKSLHDKGVQSPTTFWGLLERKHPDLSRFAMKLLKIPASLLIGDRIDTKLSFVHTNEWNRLNFEQNSKLLHCYYSLKLLDTRASDQY